MSKSCTVAASAGGLPLYLSVSRMVALTSNVPAKSESGPFGQAAFVVLQRTSLTLTASWTSVPPPITRNLAWLLDDAACPLASGVPTVRTPESWVGGLHDG